MLTDGAVDALYDERLVAELHRLGVEHLARLADVPVPPTMDGATLIAALASHRQSRFRSALILLFLRRPDYSQWVTRALESLDPAAQNTLRLYYQAAVYLRPEIENELRLAEPDLAPLPDLFSQALQLPAPGNVPTDEALRGLGALHGRLTGRALNWSGSYRQHLPLFRRQLSRHAHSALTA